MVAIEVAKVDIKLGGGRVLKLDEIVQKFLSALDVAGLSWLTPLQHCVDIGGCAPLIAEQVGGSPL